MGLRIFLQDWNGFAANTEFKIVLKYFCKIGVGLRKNFCPKRREKRNLHLKIFCPKSKKGRGSWTPFDSFLK